MSPKTNKLKLAKKEIEKIINKSYCETDPEHSKTTHEWLMKLKPHADDALQIAALAHDIERGTRTQSKKSKKRENYPAQKEKHSKRSAKIITQLLKKYDFDKKFVKKIQNLVLKHEVGGNEESNTLMNADSLSFFQSNLTWYSQKHDKDTTKFKIKYMYNRMSPQAQKLAQKIKIKNKKTNQLYKKTISETEK